MTGSTEVRFGSLASADEVFRGIGNTPTWRIKSSAFVRKNAARLYIKLEEFNAGGSIKSRVAASMIANAESKGVLNPGSGQVIIEPTGGNTGTGLAMIGARRGYRVVLVVPDNYSSEFRLQTLRMYGAEIIRTPHTSGNDSHIQCVRDIVSTRNDYIWLNQFANPSNPLTHYHTTANEILSAVPVVDYFVAGIGSGGTITGVGRRLLEWNPKLHVMGVQPSGCDSLKGRAVPHRIQGLAVGSIPEILDPTLVHTMDTVTYDEVRETIKDCARYEGLFLGISAGANLLAASRLANTLASSSVVVTIAPDGGKNYPDYLADLLPHTSVSPV